MNKKTIFHITIIYGLIPTILILYFAEALGISDAKVLEIGDTINSLVLAITAWIIAKQSFATERMAKYQVVPAIDVNMIYSTEPNSSSTYFWFSNESKLPGWVSLRYKKNDEEIKSVYPKLRISPEINGIRTADFFLEGAKVDDEIKLYVSIETAFEESSNKEEDTKIEFEKSYRLVKNKQGKKQWNETSWGFPDKTFPYV